MVLCFPDFSESWVYFWLEAGAMECVVQGIIETQVNSVAAFSFWYLLVISVLTEWDCFYPALALL